MPKYTREEKLEMIRQYREEHRSIDWISKEYGISQSYLREILKKSPNGGTACQGAGSTNDSIAQDAANCKEKEQTGA